MELGEVEETREGRKGKNRGIERSRDNIERETQNGE